MGLSSIIEALAVSVAHVAEVDAILTEVPAQLPEDRVLLLYGSPGTTTTHQHAGRKGGPVIICDDVIVLEWVYQIAADRYGEAEVLARQQIDVLRLEIWSALVATRLGGEVVAIGSVDTEVYGEMSHGSASVFGFRLAVNIQHAFEVNRA